MVVNAEEHQYEGTSSDQVNTIPSLKEQVNRAYEGESPEDERRESMSEVIIMFKCAENESVTKYEVTKVKFRNV